MDTLRISLLVIGLIILLVVYISGKPKLVQRLRLLFSKSSSVDEKQDYEEPELVDEDPEFLSQLEEFSGIKSNEMPHIEESDEVEPISVISESDDVLPEGEPLVIIFTIMAKPDQSFNGNEIKLTLDGLGFSYGDMEIYHLKDGEGENARAICSMASAFEPGTLPVHAAHEFSTKGLVLFTQLPGPKNPQETLELVIEIGQAIAQALAGDFCDETHSAVTNQTIHHLKEKVEAFSFKQKVSELKRRNR